MKSKFSVRNLNLYYWSFHALKDINIDIPAGRVTALIGPAGCGKSSFLRTLNRLNDLFDGVRIEGKVLLNGEDIYQSRYDVARLRRRVGMIFSRPNPFPMSIYDNVAFGPRLHGCKKREELDEIVERSLQEAGLWDEVRDNLFAPALILGKGQQQLLCLARALALRPEVLLLDEPGLDLDPLSVLRLEERIQELKDGLTIVIVTTHTQQAARTSDYTAFFWQGELIEFGRTDELFTRPRDVRTEGYLSGRFG